MDFRAITFDKFFAGHFRHANAVVFVRGVFGAPCNLAARRMAIGCSARGFRGVANERRQHPRDHQGRDAEVYEHSFAK